MKNFLILYGTVTGKAQSIAEMIHRESESHGFESTLVCLADLEKFDLKQENCVVFVSSTTGDGEQPEPVRPFYSQLCRSLPSDYLVHLEYTILGLGDTNYSQFCNGPKMLHKRLKDLGAKTFYEPGWADDGLGLEIVVEPWIDGLWECLDKCPSTSIQRQFLERQILAAPIMNGGTLKSAVDVTRDDVGADVVVDLLLRLNAMKLSQGNDLSSVEIFDSDLKLPAVPGPFLEIDFDTGEFIKETSDDVKTKFPLASTEIYRCPIVKSRRLTQDGAVKTALEVVFDLKDTDISREPGDAISVICPNPGVEVDAILERLGYSSMSNRLCKLRLKVGAKKSEKIPEYFPLNYSLKHLFTHHLDIRSVPKKPLLRILAEYTTDPKERRCLEYFCSRQGSSSYLEKIRGSNLCLLDILLTFTSCHPPVERIIEHLPRLQPRAYSIASFDPTSSLANIVFNVVDISSGDGRKFSRKGICSGWLQELIQNRLNENPLVRVFGRQSKSFRLCTDISTPFIMIGPGTGVAPFIGFLQKHRERLLKAGDQTHVGPAWLFFGCRNKHLDFLYESEIDEFLSDGTLKKFEACFSRDGSINRKYVQDAIRDCQEEFVPFVFKSNAVLYVCGDARNMSKDVNETIVQCTAQVLGISVVEARKMVADLVIQGRYLQDVWT